MNLIITLDYELFLNDITGTVNNCLIKPMQEIQKICEKHDFKLTIFVDAAYLYRLTELKKDYPALEEDYKNTVDNIHHSQYHKNILKKEVLICTHFAPQKKPPSSSFSLNRPFCRCFWKCTTTM